MSDDKRDARSDTQQIDLTNADAIREWCKSLAVTEDQLRDAVLTVGPQAAKVREFLGKTVARP